MSNYEEYAGNKYYDRFDELASGEGTPESKRWDKLLFRAGTVVQSAELNEIQSVQEHYLKNLGGSIFKDGDVISGLNLFWVKEDGTNFMNILAGKVFLDGKIRQVPQQNKIRIDATGTEYLGLAKDIKYIVEGEDSSLKDPAEETDNYNQPGAHRRRIDYVWKRWKSGEDSTALLIYELIDGVQKTIQRGINFSQIYDAMARRTFDESGSYVLRPFPVSIKENPNDTTTLIAIVSPGKAYVRGYEVELGTKQEVIFEKARNVRQVTNETVTFDKDEYIYPLENEYVKQVDSVVAEVYANEAVTKGVGLSTDPLTNTPVQDIFQVVSDTTPSYDATNHRYIDVDDVYVEGVDWQKNGNAIQWIGAHRPSDGATYYVVYSYQKTLTKGVRTKTTQTSVAVTRGSGAFDVIGINPEHKDGIRVIRITDTAGASTATWIEDYDYKFITGRDPDQYNSKYDVGDQNWELQVSNILIDWSIGGSSPATASTYYVTYEYWAHTTEGDYISADSYNDYEAIDHISSSTNFTDLNLTDVLDFRSYYTKNNTNWPSLGKDDVVNQNNMIVTYQHYLSRIDVIYMDEDGQISVKKGNPALSTTARPPDSPAGTIGLAYLYIKPYTKDITEVEVRSISNRRYTMDDIHNLEDRIKRLEYFQSTQLLEDNALGKFTIAEKRGIFTDTFVGVRQSDITYDDGTRTYEVSVDPTEETLRLGFKMEASPITISSFSNGGDEDYWENTLTLPVTEKLLYEQSYATGWDSVQPFEVFDAKGELEITPESDFWVDTETTTKKIELDLTGDLGHRKSMNLGTEWGSWRTLSTGWAITRDGFVERRVDQRQGVRRTLVPETREVNIGNRIVDTSWILKIREQTIVCVAEAMRPNIDSLEVTFSGDRMTVSAAPASYVSGSAHAGDPGWYIDAASNTVKTDVNGFTAFQFTIPGDTYDIGEHEVRVDNPASGKQNRTYATHNFEARGIRNKVEQTGAKVTNFRIRSQSVTERTVNTERRRVPRIRRREGGESSDPLAQTFRTPPNNKIILSSIDLFFQSKDDNEPVMVQLRPVINGYPSSEILTYKVLNPSSVNTSSDGSLATNFKFKDPIILEQDTEYAIIVYSRSPNYNIFYGELGETDLLTGNTVISNPFSGVYFRSANASTWQADGFKDLKFRLYRCKFSSTATITWNNITGIRAGWIAPHVTVVEPPESRIDWTYSTDNGASFQNAVALDDIDFNDVKTQFQLKGQLQTTDQYVSPIIHKDKIGIISILSKTDGNYFSKDIELDTTAQFVDIYLDEFIPPNTSITVYWSHDKGHTWQQATTDPTTPSFTIDGETGKDVNWVEYHYSNSITGSVGTSFKIRINLQTSNRAKTPKVKRLRCVFS